MSSTGVPDVQLHLGDHQAAAGVAPARRQPPQEGEEGKAQEGKRLLLHYIIYIMGQIR